MASTKILKRGQTYCQVLRGYVYFLYFPQVSLFKVGKTLRGSVRFSDVDYLKAYNYYGEVSEVILRKVSRMNETEAALIHEYNSRGYKNVAKKTEYFRCNEDKKDEAEYIFNQVVDSSLGVDIEWEEPSEHHVQCDTYSRR